MRYIIKIYVKYIWMYKQINFILKIWWFINDYIFNMYVFKDTSVLYIFESMCVRLFFKNTFFPRFNDNFTLNFNNLVMVIKVACSAYNLTIRSEWYFAGERNESWAFRNYENQDVVMVITVKPCRHVDTPEVSF